MIKYITIIVLNGVLLCFKPVSLIGRIAQLKLSACGDPLISLNELVDWSVFLPTINRAFAKTRKSNAGRKPFNRIMMFKILVLQSLYRLSDHQMQFQITDRISFSRFLGLNVGTAIPDEKTIWLFRDILVKGGAIEKLFHRFDRYLKGKGYAAELGMIVDASIVEIPKQRNSRSDNAKIKKGEIPESFEKNPARKRQKDIDARWTIKNNKAYYGYKDHIQVDVKHKLIRKYVITPGSTGDIKCLAKLIHGQANSDRKLWADGAYDSEKTDKLLKRYKIINRIIYRARQGNWLPDGQARENSRRSTIRKRVEHVFGFMQNSMGGKFIRSIGLSRALGNIGLMNLTYNISRYTQLCRLGAT